MRILIWLALLGLGACSTVSLLGIARLSALSPMETDPSHIAVALELPTNVRVVQGSAKIGILATTSGGRRSDRQYVLQDQTSGVARTIYSVAEQDYTALRAQQKLVRGWEEAEPRATKGSFSIALEGCALGAGPNDEDTLSILIRTAPDAEFFALVSNAPWRDVLGFAELGNLEPC